jgi:hypothetical protein
MSYSLKVLCGFVAACCCFGTSSLQADEPMVYELRTYYCHPGKLPALHARFRDHTLKLFEKHGMKNVLYWTPVDQEDVLIYIVAHKSEAAAKASWEAFINDPAWKAAYAESTKDGKLVKKVEKQFLNPTDYSPVK